MDCSLYLVRHGRTALNAQGRLRGRVDARLDKTGTDQADRLAALFAATGLAAVISSPLTRAVQTATPIAANHRLKVQTDDGLTDRDWGPWAGQLEAEVAARFATVEAAPEIEPAEAFATRVVESIERCADLSAAAGGPLLVVAHDAVNRTLLCRLVPALGTPDTVGQRTGCWNLLRRSTNGIWKASVVDAVPGDGTAP